MAIRLVTTVTPLSNLNFKTLRLKEEGVDIEGLPNHMIGEIADYLLFGYRPGSSFLCALFANQLLEAYQHADPINNRMIPRYAEMLRQTPQGCRGSTSAVLEWSEKGGWMQWKG